MSLSLSLFTLRDGRDFDPNKNVSIFNLFAGLIGTVLSVAFLCYSVSIILNG